MKIQEWIYRIVIIINLIELEYCVWIHSKYGIFIGGGLFIFGTWVYEME